MAKVKYTPEQIIIKLREVEVLCGKGSSIAEAVRQIGVTEQTITVGVKNTGTWIPSKPKGSRSLRKRTTG